MNKYEKELLKHITDDSIVYELRRAKAYFLIIDGQDARLVEIGKDLTALSYDLTDKTVLKERNNYFNFGGKRYILVKKIQ